VRSDMEFWRDVRRQVLTGELSRRAACRKFGLGWHTLKKILSHEEPPGYRQSEPRPKRKLEPFVPIIHQILSDDRQAPKKQRHTARRIFERLRDEHGYQGSHTVVKDAVRAWKQSRQEVFLPLSHPPGEAQVDFGEATIRLAGQETKVALFVMTLPYSGAIIIQTFPRECTETFLEGHRRAFEFFGGVPKRISYDNSAIAVIEVLSGRERKLTREFLRLQSHYLFREHFCLVRRANEKWQSPSPGTTTSGARLTSSKTGRTSCPPRAPIPCPKHVLRPLVDLNPAVPHVVHVLGELLDLAGDYRAVDHLDDVLQAPERIILSDCAVKVSAESSGATGRRIDVAVGVGPVSSVAVVGVVLPGDVIGLRGRGREAGRSPARRRNRCVTGAHADLIADLRPIVQIGHLDRQQRLARAAVPERKSDRLQIGISRSG
jgi:transposase